MENRNPLISVIIPVFNSEKHLIQCLNSLILQTYNNLEIICINDGSEDDSLKILEEYRQKDERIKIINQENLGQSHARNKGLDVATGDYITFADSDDWVSLSLYGKFVKALNSSETEFDTYMFNYVAYFEKPAMNMFKNIHGINTKNWGKFKPDQIYRFEDCRTPFSGNMAIWNKIYDKRLLEGIRFEENYIFEDQLFYLQTSLKSKGIYINNEVEYFYRQNEVSTVHTLGGNAFDIFRILDKMESVLKEKGVYEQYKYAFLQHKYTEALGLLSKVIPPLKESFFNTAKNNLIKTVDDSFDSEIIKKMNKSKLYLDMVSMEFSEFAKKYS